ncbi:MAG: ferrous iron transport protein B [Oscillospiraceae bacterium]
MSKAVANSTGKKIIALAGNPNVGKSTVFNALTGLHQHTGNWAGKTVENAEGEFSYNKKDYVLVDLPGTYSLLSHSKEEEYASDYISSLYYDAIVVVCDATCLERNLNLVLQTIEICQNTIVCVNLMDEAKKKGLSIDLNELSLRLGVPVVGVAARSKDGLDELLKCIECTAINPSFESYTITYSETIERAILSLSNAINSSFSSRSNSRYIAVQLIYDGNNISRILKEYYDIDVFSYDAISNELLSIQKSFAKNGFSLLEIRDEIVETIVKSAETICSGLIKKSIDKKIVFDKKLDKLFMSKKTGIPVMIILLALIFWITIYGANYPSELLSSFLFKIQDYLLLFFDNIGVSPWLRDMLILGVFRVLAWVVAVMLPPMAIFFPMFTLLEDFGYLPRVAFNLDHHFRKAGTCGKQALTMCMGIGCNAVGITGARIIDSPRERLIAIITNNFMPCNGRFPTIISIITMFFIGGNISFFGSFYSTAILTFAIIFSVFITFQISKLLSKTLLKGVNSSFTLELPPYRKPQMGKVIVRSMLDRTIFVLGRAVVVAAPAGLIIWLLANISIGDASLLTHICEFLNPFAKLLGMDGVILTAFILGFPANEIVFPIIIMAYMATGNIMEFETLSELKMLLLSNGWTLATAISVILFSLMHWPCSTSLLTIKKETGSIKWTAVSFLVPTITGMVICFLFNLIVKFTEFMALNSLNL